MEVSVFCESAWDKTEEVMMMQRVKSVQENDCMNKWMTEKIYVERLKAYKNMLNLPRLAENSN